MIKDVNWRPFLTICMKPHAGKNKLSFSLKHIVVTQNRTDTKSMEKSNLHFHMWLKKKMTCRSMNTEIVSNTDRVGISSW